MDSEIQEAHVVSSLIRAQGLRRFTMAPDSTLYIIFPFPWKVACLYNELVFIDCVLPTESGGSKDFLISVQTGGVSPNIILFKIL